MRKQTLSDPDDPIPDDLPGRDRQDMRIWARAAISGLLVAFLLGVAFHGRLPF